jgi:hypothetical protein
MNLCPNRGIAIAFPIETADIDRARTDDGPVFLQGACSSSYPCYFVTVVLHQRQM